MEKICFIDISNSGHHWFYNYNLLDAINKTNRVYFYGLLNNDMKDTIENKGINYFQCNYNNKFNKIKKECIKYKILINIVKLCKKNQINKCVFLYLDEFLLSIPFAIKYFEINGIKIIGILHWYPNIWIKKILLKILVNSKSKIIVHTKFMKKKLCSKNNVFVINYPLSNNRFQNEEKIIDRKESFTLLYFGGTRYDKGLDILLKSLKCIDYKYISLIIAGKEESYSKEFIENEISNYKNIKVKMDLNFISDKKMNEYFKKCDIVVLPYRKIFAGESGVLTESINYLKPVIVPNIIHFPEIINKYNNGIIYEAENSYDLAQNIIKLINNYDTYKDNAIKMAEEYCREHSLEKFSLDYKKIIEY